jgi:hypothetical protein
MLLTECPAAVSAQAALSLNRCLAIHPIQEKGSLVGLEVHAPVRGHGLRVTRVDAAVEPAVFQALMSLRGASRASRLQLDARVAEQLRGAGVLVPRPELPRMVRYACFIDTHGGGAPAHAPAGSGKETRWLVNPTLRVLSGTGGFAAPWTTSPLADAHALASLVLPGSGVSFAYWLQEPDAVLLRRLASHDMRPRQLDPATLERYARAGLLTTAEALYTGWRRASHRLQRRREHLAREGWVRLPGLLPRQLVASLQDYVNPLVDEGHLRFNDAQSRRYFQHSEPMAVWLHQQLGPYVQALATEPVKRSYAFLGGYVEGSDLKPHVDRDQCEYTLSLTLDAQPGRRRADAWPLGLTDRLGADRWAKLAPGDALLFKGRELHHFRRPLAAGRRSISAFLHFVPVEFDGHLN